MHKMNPNEKTMRLFDKPESNVYLSKIDPLFKIGTQQRWTVEQFMTRLDVVRDKFLKRKGVKCLNLVELIQEKKLLIQYKEYQ